MISNLIADSSGGVSQAEFDALDERVRFNSDSGIIGDLSVTKDNDTTLRISDPSGKGFQVVEKGTGIRTIVTLPSDITLNTVTEGLPASGSWFLTIKKYDGTWENPAQKYDVGTDITFEWFTSQPLGRGRGNKLILRKFFYPDGAGGILSLSGGSIFNDDHLNAHLFTVLGVGAANLAVSNDRVSTELDVSEGIGYRFGVYGRGIYSGVFPASQNIVSASGMNRPAGGTGLAVREHVFGRTNNPVQFYANLAAFPGTGSAGIYYVANDTLKVYVWDATVYTEAPFNFDYIDNTTFLAKDYWKYWDDSSRAFSDTLTSVLAPNNKWLHHYIYVFPFSQNPIWVTAQKVYDTVDEAEAEQYPVINTRTVEAVQICGIIINTSASDISSAIIQRGKKFRIDM